MHEESTKSAATHAAAGTAAEATGGREGTETAPQVPAAGCSCVYVCVCAPGALHTGRGKMHCALKVMINTYFNLKN